MQDSNLLMYVASEVAVLLLAACIFLCFHIGTLKKLIGKLEAKISKLRKSATVSRKETKIALDKLAKSESVKPKMFLDYLDEEIERTLGYHKSLKSDRDIVLDITPEASVERQVTSLRHAFLIAEKEARHAGDDNHSDWHVLQAKLAQIIQFYKGEAPVSSAEGSNVQEIDNYKRQIKNLSRYKKLFIDTENKWRKAKVQAEDYYQQLMDKCKLFEENKDFEELLEGYAHAYDEVATMVSEGCSDELSSSSKDVHGDMDTNTVGNTVGNTIVIANQEEMQRLKSMAADQHNMITKLKNKLVGVKTPEEYEKAIAEVLEQLEKQSGFLKEAEICTQLVEDELTRTLEENEQLHSRLDNQGDGLSDDEIEKLEVLVSDLTDESKHMLVTIAKLEEENQSLKQTLGSDVNGESSEDATLLKEKLGDMQQELLNMQTQQIELEERYLELKMSSN